ncbi:MAG TPA: DUF4129 domain-containing protein [Roseiflexaceae bacterium]|nr:DUF4129 domain-containing protein [Roseiflexaceae bacterium]
MSARATLALLALLALLGAPRAALAQTQEPDLPTYEGWVREAFAAAQRSDRLGLEDAAERLVATERVVLPDGSAVSVDNGWLGDQLELTDPDLGLVSERLGALIDALAQPGSSAPGDATERLREILSRPPFGQPESGPNWLGEFFDWLGRLLERLFEPLGDLPPGTGNVLGWVIAIIGGVLVVGVVIYLVLGVRRNLVSEVRVDEDDPEANLTARTALDQAGDLAREGDYRTAVRYLYLSALLWLDERDLLRYDRALTNREYLEQVRDNPDLRARLAPIVETFDRVWYGHTPLDAGSFAAYRAQVEALRKES